ncbi:MAG: hypothetical protein ACYCZD_05825 [Rhodanobacter sp.]
MRDKYVGRIVGQVTTCAMFRPIGKLHGFAPVYDMLRSFSRRHTAANRTHDQS